MGKERVVYTVPFSAARTMLGGAAGRRADGGQAERFPFFCEREHRKLNGIPPADNYRKTSRLSLISRGKIQPDREPQPLRGRERSHSQQLRQAVDTDYDYGENEQYSSDEDH